MKTKRPKLANMTQLANESGCDRQSMRKWFEQAGLRAHKGKGIGVYYDHAQAMEILRAKMEKRKRLESEPNFDPDTGLTWAQKKVKEEAIALARENEIQEAVKRGDWMTTEKHHQIVAAIVGRIEQVPGKAKSQLGLSDRQQDELRKMLDECREEAAREVEKMEAE